MNAADIGLYLSLIVLGLASALWVMMRSFVKFKRTEQYLCGEPSKDFSPQYIDITRNFKMTLKAVYSILDDYFTSGIWNEWFTYSLPYLFILLLVMLALYLKG